MAPTFFKIYRVYELMMNFSQDELAETQIAEPGYAGTNHEIEMNGFEFELFGYWDDLEYADDPYWEYDVRQRRGQAESEHTGQKRKRGGPPKVAAMDKRRKVSGSQATAVDGMKVVEVRDNVIYISQKERCRAKVLPVLKERKPVAFLADWRQRYASQDGLVKVDMPADMQEAAQAKDADTPPNQTFVDVVAEDQQDEPDEWEDDGDEDDGMADLPAKLDRETLMAVLRQKLGAAGLNGVDEGAFMTTLDSMLAGDEDEAAGELANTLLGQATSKEGFGNALSGWLSQQGVSLDQAGDDDASSVATADLPEESTLCTIGKGRMHISPTDSGISVPGSSQTCSKEMAIHGGSPKACKENRSADEVTEGGGRTGKKVTFDVPSSSESGPQCVTEAPEAPTSEDPLLSEPTVSTTAARATKSKVANTAAVKANNMGMGGKATMADKIEFEAHHEASGKEALVESSRQTRKRKAPSHEEDDHGRQEKLAKEPATRRTRSARAKAWK